MRVAVASDHRGYETKRRMAALLTRLGHEVIDHGCDSSASCDYPDMAIPAARAVSEGTCDVALLFDGSGVGMSITANKVGAVRAALAHDEVTARRSREHNHCNALCLACDLIGDDQMKSIIEQFLATPYGAGRHSRRVEKINQLEAEERGAPATTKHAH